MGIPHLCLFGGCVWLWRLFSWAMSPRASYCVIIVTAKSEKSDLNPCRGRDDLPNRPHRRARGTCPRWPLPMGEGVFPLVQPVPSPSLSFLLLCSSGLSTGKWGTEWGCHHPDPQLSFLCAGHTDISYGFQRILRTHIRWHHQLYFTEVTTEAPRR